MSGKVEQTRELMERARAEGFSAGAFNVDNQETLLAIARAAAAARAAVLVEVSHSEVQFIGLRNVSTDPEAVALTLSDPESRRWVEQSRCGHPRREEALAWLH